jgi:hypothetical protein
MFFYIVLMLVTHEIVFVRFGEGSNEKWCQGSRKQSAGIVLNKCEVSH